MFSVLFEDHGVFPEELKSEQEQVIEVEGVHCLKGLAVFRVEQFRGNLYRVILIHDLRGLEIVFGPAYSLEDRFGLEALVVEFDLREYIPHKRDLFGGGVDSEVLLVPEGLYLASEYPEAE
ncbi:hypothetical protein BMS3Abin09_00009 [bacterium BMS3Abin09]|nr:hypothetical protein BMS3Abin09_00009 [bacterium BMS3Abin09]